jgi:hypothetical protein
MTILRALLIVLWITLVAYTAAVISSHGLGLFQVFFTDIRHLDWPGQFDLDFMMMLILSSLWVAWRHQFSPAGLGLALLALVGGSLFLSTYLLALSWRCDGEMSRVVLGNRKS